MVFSQLTVGGKRQQMARDQVHHHPLLCKKALRTGKPVAGGSGRGEKCLTLHLPAKFPWTHFPTLAIPFPILWSCADLTGKALEICGGKKRPKYGWFPREKRCSERVNGFFLFLPCWKQIAVLSLQLLCKWDVIRNYHCYYLSFYFIAQVFYCFYLLFFF